MIFYLNVDTYRLDFTNIWNELMKVERIKEGVTDITVHSGSLQM